jgi:hypothetical protein
VGYNLPATGFEALNVLFGLNTKLTKIAYLERQSCSFFQATFKKHATFRKWQEFLPLAENVQLSLKTEGKPQFSPETAPQVPCG